MEINGSLDENWELNYLMNQRMTLKNNIRMIYWVLEVKAKLEISFKLEVTTHKLIHRCV